MIYSNIFSSEKLQMLAQPVHICRNSNSSTLPQIFIQSTFAAHNYRVSKTFCTYFLHLLFTFLYSNFFFAPFLFQRKYRLILQKHTIKKSKMTFQNFFSLLCGLEANHFTSTKETKLEGKMPWISIICIIRKNSPIYIFK